MIDRTPARDRAFTRIASNTDDWLANAFQTICGHDPEALQTLYDERANAQIIADGFDPASPAAYVAAELPAMPGAAPMVEPAPAIRTYADVWRDLTHAERIMMMTRARSSGAANATLQVLMESARLNETVLAADILPAMVAAGVVTQERAGELA